MKLLIYSHYFPPSIGGVETIVLTLARGLAELPSLPKDGPLEVTVLTQTPRGNFEDSRLPFRVVRQPALGELWQFIRATDVLHLAGPSIAPLLLAYAARKPIVVEHHGFQAICPNGQLFINSSDEPCPGHYMANHHSVCLRCNSGWGWLASGRQWLLTFARRFLCARASSNVVPTTWLGTQLCLRHTIALAHGLETAVAVSPCPQAERPVVVFQGRLVSTKGVATLLEAARILKERKNTVELLIIGDGPERKKLELFARENGLSAHVRFAGSVPAEQVQEMFSHVRAVVVPSVAGEVFGLVVLENMLRGIPVIASDLGPFVEILGNTGLVFRKRDPYDLANQIAKILDDGVSAVQRARVARQRALDSYDKRRMIESHACLYQSVVHR